MVHIAAQRLGCATPGGGARPPCSSLSPRRVGTLPLSSSGLTDDDITIEWYGKHIDNPDKLKRAFVDKLLAAPTLQAFARACFEWRGAPPTLWAHAFRHALHNIGFWLMTKSFDKKKHREPAKITS